MNEVPVQDKHGGEATRSIWLEALLESVDEELIEVETNPEAAYACHELVEFREYLEEQLSQTLA